MTTKTERISARVSEKVYHTLQRAAVLVGSTVNQFLVQSALERAQTVIEEESVIYLTGRPILSAFHRQSNRFVGQCRLGF